AHVEEMGKEPAALTPLGFWAWSPELQCAFRRLWSLGQPFQPSRGGYAAPLVMFALMKDPKLRATWDKLRARRDAMLGGPGQEPAVQYLDRAGGDALKALDDLMPAIDA